MTGLVDPEEVMSTDTGEVTSAHDHSQQEDTTGLESILSPVEEEPIADEPTSSDVADEDELPEKYRGKTMREIIEMHQNAEKAMGRHSQEVGELRGLVDNFIKAQMASTKQTDEGDEDVDFLTDPERAVSRAVEKHPAVQEAQRSSAEMRKQTTLAKLNSKHPDMKEVIADPAFVEYVKASPVRMRLYQQADAEADFDAADELISSFKERKQVVTQTADADRATRKDAVKAASTGSASAATGAPQSKKVFRRADIIKLMQTDPTRYEALQDEIMAAYRDKRVR